MRLNYMPHPLIDSRLRQRRRFGLLVIIGCWPGLAGFAATGWAAACPRHRPDRHAAGRGDLARTAPMSQPPIASVLRIRSLGKLTASQSVTPGQAAAS